MPTIDREEQIRRLKVYLDGTKKGLSKTHIARALLIKPNTFREWLRNFSNPEQALKELENPVQLELPIIEPTPVERHDADFWRKKYKQISKENEWLHKLIEEMAGIRAVEPQFPIWSNKAISSEVGEYMIIAHTSDLQDGEVILPGQNAGLNEYNPEICERRMVQYFNAVVETAPRWIANNKCAGCLLTAAGDLISGDIHEELAITNALTSHQSVRHVVGIYEWGIKRLLEYFPTVHFVAVPGNHGRTTRKSFAKRYGNFSYDILIASMIYDRLRDDPRITWQIDGAKDQYVDLLGRTGLVTHGDKMGTGGGQGFAGPVLPIVRGGHKVRLQQYSIDRKVHLILHGHYHTSANPPGILANGSVAGYSEYGDDLRASVESPQQWMALISRKRGLKERLEIILD